MVKNTKLPMGIENFEEIRTKGYYFTDAKAMLRNLIGKEAMRFQFLMQSEHLTEPD